MTKFSEIEKGALERFVTSADAPIYACRAEVPSEVFGAFGSFFSRNPKDLREHLLDAIEGKIKGHETTEGAENLRKLALGEYVNPSHALRSGLSKAQDFFKQWFGKYGHESIANVVWIPFVGTGVSQMFAKQLAYDQLAFFIEQSTRFVKFDVANLYLDPEIMNCNHRDRYVEILNKAAQTYETFTELAAQYYGKELPFERWLSSKIAQEDPIIKTEEKEKQVAYKRELKAKAFDVARLLLPQAVKTNIAWILDARSTEFDIATWKGHPLAEIKESAKMIEEAGREIAPSILKYTAENNYSGQQLRGFEGALDLELEKSPLQKGVDIISHDPEALDKSLALLLMRSNRSADFSRFYQKAKSFSFEEKIHSLKEIITKHRGPRDQKVDVEEAFDCLGITIQIKSDIGAIRDLRRHQKWDRNEGVYTLDNGFYLPEIVGEFGKEAVQAYTQIMEETSDVEHKIREEHPFAVQYIIPMAAMHSLVMRGGLDQAQYFINLRTQPQGHFSYREDAVNFAEALCKVHPWILGYENYPENKNFNEVYENAPMKSILRPTLDETGWHQ
ncbi:FAD-dependent thymidylate synthase [Candidatus Woesearchaeota archaeon]|nr:FAD-dependent thymidylate synthase [Candidatus Woesearchaeota archaeon]